MRFALNKSAAATAPQDCRDHTLAERAALVCSPMFCAHLEAWRESLQAQGAPAAVPPSYVAAMRSVVAAEAAAGCVDAEDALAAAIALHELECREGPARAVELLRELRDLGSDLAALFLAAASQIDTASSAALPEARLSLVRLTRHSDPSIRAGALCLLGDSYLEAASSDADLLQPVANRFYLAATREKVGCAALAHYRLGRWYEKQLDNACLMDAAVHFEDGADRGCPLCLGALAQLHRGFDQDFAQDLHELYQLQGEAFGSSWTANRSSPGHHTPTRQQSAATSTFLDSVRGAFRGALGLVGA